MKHYIEKPKDGKRKIHFAFDGLRDLGAYLRDLPEQDWMNEGRASQNPGREDWTGGMNYQQAVDMALSGEWRKGADAVRALTVSPAGDRAPRRRPMRRVAGARPHIQAAIAGDPKSMIRMVVDDRQARAKAPVVTIMTCLVHGANVSAESYFNFGAALCSAIDAIERQGRRVELIGRHTCELRKLSWDWSVTIKRADQALNKGAVSGVVTCPAFTRRLYFRLVESMDEETADEFRGYGYGRCNGRWHRERENAVIFPYLVGNHGIDTPERARKHVAEVIEKSVEGLIVYNHDHADLKSA